MELDKDINLLAHVARLQHTKAKIAELKEMEAESKSAIQEALGDNEEEATINGDTVIRWKHIKTNRLNQRALKAEHPEIVAEYTEATEIRRFEIL